MENQPAPTPANTPASTTPARLPFDVEFFKLVETFTVTALEQLPELHGVAIIPLWVNQPENTPSGLLRLRDATPPYMASLLKLLARLATFNVEVNKDLVNQIKMFDSYAAQLAQAIQERTAALNDLPQPTPAPANE